MKTPVNVNTWNPLVLWSKIALLDSKLCIVRQIHYRAYMAAKGMKIKTKMILILNKL